LIRITRRFRAAARSAIAIEIPLQNFRDKIAPIGATESTYLQGLAVRVSDRRESAQHSGVVRITHWINALSFLGLLVSGFAILLAHPRFYWGEAGDIGTPSILDLPLPYMKGGPSGWGRNLHFFSVWVCLLNGAVYVISGILTQHFRKNLAPAKGNLTCGSVSACCGLARFDKTREGF
jgi:hypothetical protein